jgi:hypothetical protein
MNEALPNETLPSMAVPLQTPTPDVVAARLKAQFAPAYLTLISIIQGVAIAMLAGLVQTNYPRFDVVAWLLVAATFLYHLGLWNEYVIAVMAYVWFPNLFDTMIPFALLTVELFLAHFAPLGAAGLQGYLLVAGISYVLGFVGFVQASLRANAPSAVADNFAVHQRLARHRYWRMAFVGGSAVAAIEAFVSYEAYDLGRFAAFIALGLVAGHIVFTLRSVPYWNRVLTYSKSGCVALRRGRRAVEEQTTLVQGARRAGRA